MTLLIKVEHRNSGLEGLTESGEWVPLKDPIPRAFKFNYSDKYVRLEDIKTQLREDNSSYCQLAGLHNAVAMTDEIGALPCIAYLKRDT